MEICFESDCKGVIPFRDYGTFCILPPSDRLSEVSMDAVTLLLSTALWKAFIGKTGFYQQLCNDLKEGVIAWENKKHYCPRGHYDSVNCTDEKGTPTFSARSTYNSFGVEFHPNSKCVFDFQAISLLVKSWLCWSKPTNHGLPLNLG